MFSFLVMTCFLIRGYNKLPKKELHRSLQVKLFFLFVRQGTLGRHWSPKQVVPECSELQGWDSSNHVSLRLYRYGSVGVIMSSYKGTVCVYIWWLLDIETFDHIYRGLNIILKA